MQNTLPRLLPHPIQSDRITLRERVAELKRIWITGPGRDEVRETAIGWKPDDSFVEVKGTYPREYTKVIRKARK